MIIKNIKIYRYRSNIEVYQDDSRLENLVTRIYQCVTDCDNIPSASYIPTITYIQNEINNEDFKISRKIASEIKEAIRSNCLFFEK